MKKAYIFPGQGAQYAGMGKDLYDSNKALFEEANDTLGFNITEVMLNGSDEDLKATRVTQPAIFIYSTVQVAARPELFTPDMAAGHSLGEFSALTAAGALSFSAGLKLVSQRANAMQQACELVPGTMAAVLGLEDAKVEEICAQVNGVVVAANYNCPGQLVISGEENAVNEACELLKAAGAKRALKLGVGGAFHSPLMESARTLLQQAIEATEFKAPVCPIYQNVDGMPYSDPETIKKNLITQLTAPVRWTQSVKNMIADGAGIFIEPGPGKVLQGLVKKIDSGVETMPFG